MEKTIDEIRQDLNNLLRDEIMLRKNGQYVSKEIFLACEIYPTNLNGYESIEEYLNDVTVGLIYNNINSKIDYDDDKLTIYSDYLSINIEKYSDLNINIYSLLVTLALDEVNHTHFFIDQFSSALFNYCHTIKDVNLMYDFLEDISNVGILGKKMRKFLLELLIKYRSLLSTGKSRDEQRDYVETEVNKIRVKTRNIEEYCKQMK